MIGELALLRATMTFNSFNAVVVLQRENILRKMSYLTRQLHFIQQVGKSISGIYQPLR